MMRLWVCWLLLGTSAGFAPSSPLCRPRLAAVSADTVEAQDDPECDAATLDEIREVKEWLQVLQRDSELFSNVQKKILSKKDAQEELHPEVLHTDAQQHMSLTAPRQVANAIQGQPNAEETQEQSRNWLATIIQLLEGIEEVYYGDSERITYHTYPNHPEYPDVSLAGAMKKIDGLPPRPYIFSRNKIVRVLRRVLRIFGGLALTAH